MIAALRAVLVAAVLGAGIVAAAPGAEAAEPKNRWSVGVFKGSLHADYVRSHERWLGRPVETVLEIVPRDGWNRIDNPTTQLRAWANTSYDVVFTTPMVPNGGPTLAAGATGAYDEHWRRFATTMIAGGRPDARIRLGHEFNHTHYPWNATGGKEKDFAAYYRRIVTVMRSVPGAQFRFTWNVLSGVKTADVEAAYPGDDYVDVISLDLYDGARNLPSFEDRWRKYETQPYGLQWLRTFATAHRKPMAFDEWGLIKSTDPAIRPTSGDSGDDTVFIDRMLDFFETENVAYANYFDWKTSFGHTDSRIMNGPYPNASALYRRRVGALPHAGDRPSVPLPSLPVPAPAPTPTPTTGGTVLVTGNAVSLPSGDAPVRDRLVAAGRSPRVLDDDALAPTALAGADLIVISSSVVPSKIPPWLATVAAPILTGEVHAQRALGIGGSAREVEGATTIRVADPSHPLAAGRRGDVVVQAPARLAVGTPVAGATVVATAGNGAAVFAVEQGTAPARRVGFFTSYDTPPALTDAGWALFDAAVRWLTGDAAPSTASVAPGAAVAGNRVASVRDGALLTLSTGAPTGTRVVAGAVSPTGRGAWSLAGDGRVFATGDAPALGAPSPETLRAPLVALAPTPSGRGYWLLAADGGIFTHGDARFFGSTGGLRLNRPVVGMASTPSGRGYWLFAADGGIFTFGDARFFGSTGALRLNAPVTTMAPTPTGRGYWLLGADGGVFTFGDASFRGSTGADPSVGAIEAIVPTSSGTGYWLLGADARLHPFGDARR